jgi:ABC-2 type transport system ATP-binding protein
MTAVIEVEGLTKTYPSGLQALKGIDLTIGKGEIFALLGPNGAGKTTLISIICGLVTASSGRVRADGHDIVQDWRKARMTIGLVPQELTTDAFETVWSTVRFSRGLFGKAPDPAHIERVLRDLSLWDKKDAKIMTLSGGMKRRVMIAKALSHEPDILFLDEPTAGVDVELRQGLWAFVRRLNREGHTIVLTTHYLEEAQELCGRIAMLKQGRVVALERTADLLGRFGGGTVALRLSRAPLPEGLRPLLAGEPSADGRIALRLDDWQALEPVLARLREAGCHVDEMELAPTDLEDVFVRVMAGAPA